MGELFKDVYPFDNSFSHFEPQGNLDQAIGNHLSLVKVNQSTNLLLLIILFN